MKRAQVPDGRKAELVAEGHFKRDPGYLYFLDSTGDISRASRRVEYVEPVIPSKKTKKATKKKKRVKALPLP